MNAALCSKCFDALGLSTPAVTSMLQSAFALGSLKKLVYNGFTRILDSSVVSPAITTLD
jgi:hypothetical protein